MKTLFFPKWTTVVISVLLMVACTVKEKNAPDAVSASAEKISAIETFYIEFEVATNVQGMKNVMKTSQWVDVKNQRYAMIAETITEMGGMKQSNTSQVFYVDGWTTIVDAQNKMAFRVKNESGFESPLENIQPDNEEDFNVAIELAGGKIVGSENQLGYKCTVVELPDYSEGETIPTKIWYYKGIPLRIENELQTMVVKEFKENVEIPADKLKVPEGITVSEMPSF